MPRAHSEARSPGVQEIMESHMPYLDATMEEVLRCAGTAPVVDRQAVTDTELLGYVIPKGTMVTCLVAGPTMLKPAIEVRDAQRSPTSLAAKQEGRTRAWDSESIDLFHPERWLVEGKDGSEIEFNPTAGPQLAFGLGTRGCYGKRLVYVEMRIILTLILWNFELLPCPPALSDYKSVLITTNEPRQCYMRLHEIARAGE